MMRTLKEIVIYKYSRMNCNKEIHNELIEMGEI